MKRFNISRFLIDKGWEIAEHLYRKHAITLWQAIYLGVLVEALAQGKRRVKKIPGEVRS